MTLPSEARRSFVRTNAPPLPGLTCWNSTILKIVPSTSMWLPFLNWLVLIMGVSGQGTSRVGADRLRLLTPSRVADMWAVSDLAASPSAPARPLPLRLLGDDERLARLPAGGGARGGGAALGGGGRGGVSGSCTNAITSPCTAMRGRSSATTRTPATSCRRRWRG